MRRKQLIICAVLSMMCVGFLSCGGNNKATAPTQSATPPSNVDDTYPVGNTAINETARFVAGLTVDNKNSKLYALTQTKEWKNHARNMDQIWNAHYQNFPKIHAFTQNELGEINADGRTLFYPFGGPDFLFSNAFFPEMDTYFLIGLERTGQPIQVKHPSDRTYKLYQDAVSDVLSLSFFPTRDKSMEQENDTIDGVVPIISMLMARMDYQIISISDKRINSRGEIVDTNTDGSPIAESTDLVEIRFFRTGSQKQQTLYYYATDLSNEGLKKNKPLVAYINALHAESTVTFIKSASYLMHEKDFSEIRSLILKTSSSIVQDDSGIPFAYYPKNQWQITLYGTFYKPVAQYVQYSQTALRDAYQLSNPKSLAFRVGFSRQSNLQVMRRK